MPEIVNEFYEQGHHAIQYRLYNADGTAVEPIVRVPMELWSRVNDEQRAVLRDFGVGFDAAHYPELTEERPADGTNAKRRRDKATDGAPIDSDDAADTDQPSKGSKPARERG